MPKLKMVTVQAQKELLIRVEDLVMEMHALMRFQEGDYVEDVGPRMYKNYVVDLANLARATLDVQKFYMRKQWLVDQEAEIMETMLKRQRGQTIEHESSPAKAPASPVSRAKARVRL